jgi:cyclophilin family peptidyl-prolyl cis-trans isomerase
MKNIILSIVVIGLVAVGGNFVFSKDKTADSTNLGIEINNYGTTTDSTKPVFEDGSISEPVKEEITNNNKKSNMVTIETNYGKIVFETYNSDAPNTVKNFVTLAQKGFYNGLIFHRVINGFMIQGGDPNGNGTGGPGYKFDDELNQNTASYKAGYKKGVVAMANAGPNTNGSQFFIMHQDYPLPNAYTIFGKVISGQDVVDKIANVQTGANDTPVSPVTMTKVSVE